MAVEITIVANPIAVNTQDAAKLCDCCTEYFVETVAPTLGVHPFKRGSKTLWSYQRLVDKFAELSGK